MKRFRPNSIRLDRRHWWLGISSALKWMKKPVSEEGATQVSRFMIGLQGQRFLTDIEQMRDHPVGRRLLKEKPDLPSVLTPEYLATMPLGSFGHAYYQLVCEEDTLPGYLLGGLIYRDGFFDSLDIDEDTAWYLERRMFDHDASHIISGYGTDLAGEVLNIMFIQGHTRSTPRSRRFMTAPGLIAFSSRTTIGFMNWARYLTEAYDRGAASARHLPHSCIPYEELLPKPLGEVREYLGVEPLPVGWDTSGWCRKDPYAGMDPTEKESQAEMVALVDKMVKQGMSWREYMRVDSDMRERVHGLIRQGAGVDEVAALLR